jgi:ABC-type cobalamin/Fe3+-siderophores transport system ATPase subunit
MLLKSAKIRNFKCFLDSGTTQFGKNWTVVVGQNNSGKSTFLSALKPGGLASVPYKGVAIDQDLPANPNSSLEFQIEVTGFELKRVLLSGNYSFYWNMDRFYPNVPNDISQTIDRLFQEFLDENCLNVTGTFDVSKGYSGFHLCLPDRPTIFPGRAFARIQPNSERNGFQVVAAGEGADDGVIATWLHKLLMQSIYKFDAERMHIGTSSVDNVILLQENGANLAQVLHKLKENDHKFDEFLSCVKVVLPNVTGVVPTVSSSNTVEVKIQFHNPAMNREDLNFGLRECGTGTSQVLCILYVVVTSRHPKIIIIDEPNSFLHPGASKRLIEVMKNYPQHQFIIATHSPELIQVADPDNLLLIKWSDAGSFVSDIERSDIESVRFLLGELGVGLSDVFGLERAVWVEGPTEVECFPMLLKNAGLRQSYGVGFVPIRTVGNLTGKQKVGFLNIYRDLIATNKILPTAAAFSLDSEGLDGLQKNDLKRQLGDSLRFLPRRCFENYLLHGEALVALFNSFGEEITVHDVTQFFEEKRRDQNRDDWLSSCDGAAILIELVSSLTNSRHQYLKVRHGRQLVEWILEHDAIFLAELSEYVKSLCEGTSGPITA